MNPFLLLPILVPLTTAVLAILLRRSRLAQRGLGILGAAGLLASGIALLVWVRVDGVQATELGDWPAPFGITLVADLFTAIMVTLAGVMALAVAVYSITNIDARRETYGYYSLLHILLMGVCGAFLTGDIFNLFVWFEVMLIASFVLMALGGERAQMEGAIKYVTLNLIASAMLLAAVGITYGMAGTLNMADLSLRLGDVEPAGMVTTVAMLFMIAFGIKAAAFPLFFWLPASYHTPPAAVSAILAALLTKVGVYSLVRVFTLMFTDDVAYTHNVILVVAGFTMVTGVLGAVAQTDIRRLLSFHIVSQIGYLLMGLGIYTSLALAGMVYFMAHVILSKSALFLVAGVTRRIGGTDDLKKLGGMYATQPWLAVLFLVPALSLAGIPPLSGFFAKLALVRAGMDAEQYAIVAFALGVSLLTLLSMSKIWVEAFLKPQPLPREDAALEPPHTTTRLGWTTLVTPMAVIALLIVGMGVVAGPLFDLSTDAAAQLIDPTEYVEAVLGAQE
jgi:multicomponent Na+:H+ antiporter subunit D